MKMRNILFGATFMFTAAASMAAESYKEAWDKGYKEYKAKKYKEAAVTLGEAVKLAKTPAEKYSSMYHQGYALQRVRKFADAAKVYEELLNVDKLTQAQKDKAFSQYLHNVYWGKNYKEVVAIAEKTLADEKASKNIKTTSVYLACLASGNLNKNEDKIKWARKMQELWPSGTWHDRGLIYQAQALRTMKKYDEADAVLSKEAVAKMHPYWQGEAYLERGRIKAYNKKYDEAVLEYITAYNIPKGHPNQKEVAIVCIIERLDHAGKPDEAMEWIEKVSTIRDNNKYWKSLGSLRAARVLQKKGKLKEAKAMWEQCLKYGKWWKKEADKQIAVIDKKLKSK